MRAMKDSGVEWIGDIPANWQLAPAKRFFRNDKKIAKDSAGNFERLALTMAGVIKRNKNDTEGLQPEKFETYQIVEKNNLIFKLIDLQNIRTSRVGLSPYTGLVSPAYIVLANKRKDNRFFYYWFAFMYYTEVFNHLGDSGVRSSLNATDVLNLPVPSISIDEQQRIADHLDRQCAAIDASIEKEKESIARLEEYKQSVITEAVTRGLNPTVPMKDSGIEWFGQIPVHWEIVRFKNIMHKEKLLCAQYNGENIISLSMKGVHIRDLNAGGKMPSTFNGYQYVEPGDLLLCLFDIDVTPRCVGLVRNRGLTSPAYSCFKVHSGYCNAYYDYLLRYIDDYKIFVHLSKNLRSTLTESEFGALCALVPPFEEQQQIASYLDVQCGAIDRLISRKQSVIAKLAEYKKSLIYEAVTGKREV